MNKAIPWEELKNIKLKGLTRTMKTPVLVDCCSILDYTESAKKLHYMANGVGPSC